MAIYLTISDVIVSKHGEQQLRKRVGIPRKAIQRHLEKVLDEGKRDFESRSRFRRWASWAMLHYGSDIFYFYNSFVYAFAREGEKWKLVTVLYEPHDGAWEN